MPELDELVGDVIQNAGDDAKGGRAQVKREDKENVEID
jgi:hypothetical protein